jgi:hypothetical protein
LAYEREQEKTAAKCRQEKVAVMAALALELREPRDTDPGMSLLNAVEFITPAPDRPLPSTDAAVLRIGASMASVKTTPVFWKSPPQLPGISHYWSAVQWPKVSALDEMVTPAGLGRVQDGSG